jgi:hypothetical protein
MFALEVIAKSFVAPLEVIPIDQLRGGALGRVEDTERELAS